MGPSERSLLVSFQADTEKLGPKFVTRVPSGYVAIGLNLDLS